MTVAGNIEVVASFSPENVVAHADVFGVAIHQQGISLRLIDSVVHHRAFLATINVDPEVRIGIHDVVRDQAMKAVVVGISESDDSDRI